MKLTLLASLFALSTLAHAKPEVYPTLAEVAKADVFRLTCSDTKHEMQAHIYLVVANGKPESLAFLGITPAYSIDEIQIKKEDLAWLDYSVSPTELKIQGTIEEYFARDISLVVKNSPKGLVGTVSYDDHDGQSFTRQVKCGAINYIRPL